MSIEKGNKKVISAWTWFDWANSVYPLVITTAVFPLYFGSVMPEELDFLGMHFKSTELYAYSISFSFLLVSLISPILSGIADYAGRKRLFMQIFSTIGAFSSSMLFFFEGPENLWLGLLFSVLASIGFAGSLVFYNAFLPEIAHEDQMDMVSARGFTMGYIGSSILLIINLVMIQKPEFIGLSKEDIGLATRLSFLMAGIWWFAFGQVSFAGLPKRTAGTQKDMSKILGRGFHELQGVLKLLFQEKQKRLRLFLMAFFFYSMGYMTVIYLASIFGKKELHLETGALITTVLIIQFVAIGGSYFFAWLSKKIGNIRSIAVSVVIWTAICFITYFVKDENGFYMVAFFVGTVMGGIQSLSRSTYAKLLPDTHDHASFYSFYDITEKLAITLGSYVFGMVERVTGSMRNSAMFLAVFFFIGFVLLVFVERMKSIDRNKE